MPNRWRPVLAKGLNFPVHNLYAQLPIAGKGTFNGTNVVVLNNNGTGFGSYTYTSSYSVENMGQVGRLRS